MRPGAPFSVQVRSGDDVVWLALRGELDMSVVDLMREHLDTLARNGVPSIVLDLRDLAFIDSSGLHAILGAWKVAEANGHRFRLVGVGQGPRRVFEVTKTDFLIDDAGVVGISARPAAMPRPMRQRPPGATHD